MLGSLCLIFLVSLMASSLCQKLKLPGIVGMLLTGVVLGPQIFNLIDGTLLGISSQLRQIALIIILIKAGLSLNLSDLKKVGRPAVMMSFVPASFEILGYFVFAPILLGLTKAEAALTGAVLAAVSPAVVVPRMVRLMEEGYGTDKSIPQMILAGASCDDVFVIVLFSSFTDLVSSGKANLLSLVSVPISILTGVALGAVRGVFLSFVFEKAYKKGSYIRNSIKVIIVLAVAFGLMSAETTLKKHIPLSGLLAVVSMACILKIKSPAGVSARLSAKFGKLWLRAEVTLFVLVGAAVDIRYTTAAGVGAILLIFVCLVFRAVGVCVCLLGTSLTIKEKLFCILAYLPKATVQAAIGSVPLAMGFACGNTVLSVAVLGILITAPMGAFAIDNFYKKLLEKEKTTVTAV